MTIQNYIETIQQLFPNILESQIIYELNKASLEFVDSTKCIRKRLLGIAQTYQSKNGGLPNNWDMNEIIRYSGQTYDYHKNMFLGLNDIYFYDENNNPVYIEKLKLMYNIQNDILIFHSLNNIDELPSQIKYIVFDCYLKPRVLNHRNSENYNSPTLKFENGVIDIPEEFADAILHRVLESFYAKFYKEADKWTAVQYHQSKYGELKTRAISRRYQNKDYIIPNIVLYDYAGIKVFNEPTKSSFTFDYFLIWG